MRAVRAGALKRPAARAGSTVGLEPRASKRSTGATTAGRPAPRRERSTPIRRATRRSWVCPMAKTTRAGPQQAMRSRARARRAAPRNQPDLRLRAARQARPTTLRARPEAAPVRRPEGPTRAAHRRALPRTEAVLPQGRPGRQARRPTQAREEAVRRPAEVEAARLRVAAEVAPPRVAAEAALPRAAVRIPVEQALADRQARPKLETARLSGAVRPTSMSACCQVSLPAARPTKARVGPSPTSVARQERAPRPADPSSGWPPAAEESGRPSTQPTPVAELSPAEPRSAPQAVPGPAGSPSRCATVTRAGRRSCSSCPWTASGGP